MGSKSFKVADDNTCRKLVASACYVKQQICAYRPICNRLYAREANSGKITTFREVPVFARNLPQLRN